MKSQFSKNKSLNVINTGEIKENCAKNDDKSFKNQKKLQIDKVFVRMLQECMSADQVYIEKN